jgi:hypothetical protein
MQARTYRESQGKPVYVIREVRETIASPDDEIVMQAAINQNHPDLARKNRA